MVEPEMGLPMLLKDILPIGIKGIIVAAYFSAIMSTADSCLIASSGNIVNDLIERYFMKNSSQKTLIRVSQVVTFVIGIVTIYIASSFQSVLDIILHAYSFMVAGLFIPTLAAYFMRKQYPPAAMASMFAGGGLTLFLIFSGVEMPYGLDPSFWGIITSLVVFFGARMIFMPRDFDRTDAIT
jgi:SSS family solute:Na+ symporter